MTVSLSGVTKFFGTREVLRHIDLDVADGEIVTILGPSGSGKTTLLRIVAGLETTSSGMATVDGESPLLAADHKHIGWVPQSPALLPWRTVATNASLLLDINRTATAPPDDRPSIDELLDEVGLSDFVNARPAELSGGMKQRVSLVRAMALGARLLLMDEPFAALDEITRTEMRHLVTRLCEPRATTVLFVTHSVPEAVFLADRVVVLTNRPGRVVDIVPIDLPRPRDPSLEDSPEFFAITRHLRALLRAGMGLDVPEAPDWAGRPDGFTL